MDPVQTIQSWRPDNKADAEAVGRARKALSGPLAFQHLTAYYSDHSNYAGATFLNLGTNDPFSVGPDDLLAVTTLSVDLHPYAIRTLLGERAPELAEHLQAVDPRLALHEIDAHAHAPLMGKLYELVKSCLGRSGSPKTNAWVTASKLCARKRPLLFPVRDNVVLDYLGLPKNYPVDWPAFASVVRDAEVISRLQDLVRRAALTEGVTVGDPNHLLRHLDVVLWMHATVGASSPALD